MTAVLVWFKRDLRVHDHAAQAAALAAARAAARAAAQSGHAAGINVIKPTWLSGPEFSPSQLAHVLACLAGPGPQGELF